MKRPYPYRPLNQTMMNPDDDEDFPQKQDEGKGSHWFPCALILFNVLVGGGLISLPASIVAAGGFIPGFTLLAIYAVILWTVHISLAWCSDVKQTGTYQETVQALLGTGMEVFLLLALMLNCLLLPMFLLIAIGDMLTKVSVDIFGLETYCSSWYLDREFQQLMVLLCIMFPACIVKHIDMLKYISAMATVGIFSILAICTYTYFSSSIRATDIPTWPENFWQVFMAIPGFSIAFTNHVATISVYARSKPRTLSTIAKASGLAMSLGAFFYISVPFLIISLYGSAVADDFTESFTVGGIVLRLTLIIYALKLSFEAPVLIFVGRQCCVSILNKLTLELEKPEPTNDDSVLKRLIISIVWLTVVFLGATFFPSISYLESALGILSVIVVFIFPGLCVIGGVRVRNFEGLGEGRWGYVYGAVLVLMGLFLCLMMLVQAASLLSAMKSDYAAEVCAHVAH